MTNVGRSFPSSFSVDLICIKFLSIFHRNSSEAKSILFNNLMSRKLLRKKLFRSSSIKTFYKFSPSAPAKGMNVTANPISESICIHLRKFAQIKMQNFSPLQLHLNKLGVAERGGQTDGIC